MAVSQNDIAKACGVSVMTVSRALRGQRGVDPAVRGRIKRAADDLGYKPDPMLSALVAHRMRRRSRRDYSVIAFVTHFPTEHGWRSDHVAVQTYEGASKRGLEMGYSLQHFWVPDYERRGQNLSRVLFNRGVRGLLLSPLPSLDVQPRMDWERFSVVAIGYTIIRPEFTFVASHHSHALSQIIEETRKLKYRRPGLIFNPWADERSLHQLSGAWYYDSANRPARDRIPIWKTTQRPTPAEVRKWVNRHKPDVVIDTFSPDLPILTDTGLSSPEDVGYANTNVKAADGQLAGIYQNFSAMGAAAMDRLGILINRGETGIPEVREGSIIFGTWCAGKSLRRQS